VLSPSTGTPGLKAEPTSNQLESVQSLLPCSFSLGNLQPRCLSIHIGICRSPATALKEF